MAIWVKQPGIPPPIIPEMLTIHKLVYWKSIKYLYFTWMKWTSYLVKIYIEETSKNFFPKNYVSESIKYFSIIMAKYGLHCILVTCRYLASYMRWIKTFCKFNSLTSDDFLLLMGKLWNLLHSLGWLIFEVNSDMFWFFRSYFGIIWRSVMPFFLDFTLGPEYH